MILLVEYSIPKNRFLFSINYKNHGFLFIINYKNERMSFFKTDFNAVDGGVDPCNSQSLNVAQRY